MSALYIPQAVLQHLVFTETLQQELPLCRAGAQPVLLFPKRLTRLCGVCCNAGRAGGCISCRLVCWHEMHTALMVL